KWFLAAAITLLAASPAFGQSPSLSTEDVYGGSSSSSSFSAELQMPARTEAKKSKLHSGEMIRLRSHLSWDSAWLFANDQALIDLMSVYDDGPRRLVISRLLDTGALLEIPNGDEAVVADSRILKIADIPVAVAQIRLTSGRFKGRGGVI